MILWSQQHHIISSISLSFENLKKIHPKTSGSALERDKIFLNPNKFELYTVGNFKFIVLWTVFKHSSNRIDTFKLLQGFTKEDLKEILKQKENISLYENTFNKDKITASTKIVTPRNVIQMSKQDIVSPLYLYWYFQQHKPEGRIQTRNVERNDFFVQYFPKIKDYLNLKKV